MAFDLFKSQKQSTTVKESQVGVQGGGESSATVGFGSIETGSKSSSKVVQGGGIILDTSGSVNSKINIESLDPLAIEAVAQSNLVVGEIAARSGEAIRDVAAQSNLVAGEVAARGMELAQNLAGQSNVLALQMSERAGSLADKVSDVAKQGINYANQSLIKALEALQIVSSNDAQLATASVESDSTSALPEPVKRSLKLGWLFIGAVVLVVVAVAWFVFFRKSR